MKQQTSPNCEAEDDKLFELFLKEKQFLDGASPATIRIYSKSWLAFKRHNGEITKSGVKAFMVDMLGAGVKPVTANSYARSINSFLSWLFENDFTEEHLKVPLTKEPKRVLRPTALMMSVRFSTISPSRELGSE